MLHVTAFYHFADVPNPAALRPSVVALGEAEGLTGTILLAAEGVNGTVAGPLTGLERLLAHLRGVPGCAKLEAKYSSAEAPPFARLKVRLKREIVTMNRPEVRPSDGTGTYVTADDWNDLIAAPDVAVIDTRNAYEVRLGTFAGAIDPGIESFSDFPAWWEANRAQLEGKRIAMFCTGGIRCEKSTALLRAQGVEEVYHLKGGILKYLEDVASEESRWQGECFVFDQRVALTHGLGQGDARMCHACREPVTPEDMGTLEWEEGVSCPHCVGRTSEADRERFRERQRQIVLARGRGARHLA